MSQPAKITRITIVGRPNVGKSSLFNALLGFRRTIVLDLPGTTMDEIVEEVKWEGRKLELADSQGIFSEEDEKVLQRLLTRADAIVLVVDAKSGLTPFDKWVAHETSRVGKPTLLVVNKVDRGDEADAVEFSELGFPEMVAISVSHRKNIQAVKDFCLDQVDEISDDKEEEPLALALIGRPNVGKSTLMNRLSKEETSRVSPKPLTTRDPVAFTLSTEQGPVRLIDTAGIRRPRSKKEDVEVYSIHAATRTIHSADVVFLVVAAHEPLTDQDMRLLSLLEREGKPCALLLNFWDRLSSSERKNFLYDSDFSLYLERFKTLPISALTGWNTNECLPLARRLFKQSRRRVKTSQLNRIVEGIVARNPPPSGGRSHFNILYASQVKVDPPTFVFFMNRKGSLPPSYQRYLENQLRGRLGFSGQALRLHFRSHDRS